MHVLFAGLLSACMQSVRVCSDRHHIYQGELSSSKCIFTSTHIRVKMLQHTPMAVLSSLSGISICIQDYRRCMQPPVKDFNLSEWTKACRIPLVSSRILLFQWDPPSPSLFPSPSLLEESAWVVSSVVKRRMVGQYSSLSSNFPWAG